MRSILFSILLIGCLSLASSQPWKRSSGQGIDEEEVDKDLMLELKEGIENMQRKVTDWGKAVEGKMKELIEDMKKTDFAELAEKAKEKIRAIEGNLKKAVSDLREKMDKNEDLTKLKKKVDQLKSELSTWMESATVQVEAEFKVLKEKVVVYYGIFKDKLVDLKNKMGAQWKVWMDKYLPNNGKDLMNEVKEGIDKMGKKIADWGKKVEHKMKELMEGIKESEVGELAEKAKQKIHMIEGKLKEAIADLREKMNKNENLNELKSKVEEFKNRLGPWMQNANTQVENELKLLKTKIVEYYRIFKDKLVELKNKMGAKWNAWWKEVSDEIHSD